MQLYLKYLPILKSIECKNKLFKISFSLLRFSIFTKILKIEKNIPYISFYYCNYLLNGANPFKN